MVILAKQDYSEARKSGVLEEDLEFVGLVESIGTVGSGKKGYISGATQDTAILKAKESLRGAADDYGATHVYGVDYKFLIDREVGEFSVFMFGDGYKPRSESVRTISSATLKAYDEYRDSVASSRKNS